ncbi:MAG: 1-acyl-sn-glycerol-3-phosphate acyltransferase [Myxococcales bacterium]|nr:1-acyl-sn-glycerol-3-phosphate acyltransferase [Myxococcales bacterium]
MSEGSLLLALDAARRTIGISIPTVLDALVGRYSHDRSNDRLRRWANGLIERTCTTLDISGIENLPAQPCVLMSNHQSYSDIPLIYSAIPEGLRLRMVAKYELFYVPIWGRAMRASGFIPIVRSDRKKAIASLEEAKQQIGSGTYVWIAPEGTRSRTQKLGSLKKGGFILARDVGVPIAPLCISGSHAVMPPQGWRLHRGHTVRIHFGAPIATADRSLEDVMRDVALAIDPDRVFATQPSSTGSP